MTDRAHAVANHALGGAEKHSPKKNAPGRSRRARGENNITKKTERPGRSQSRLGGRGLRLEGGVLKGYYGNRKHRSTPTSPRSEPVCSEVTKQRGAHRPGGSGIAACYVQRGMGMYKRTTQQQQFEAHADANWFIRVACKCAQLERSSGFKPAAKKRK